MEGYWAPCISIYEWINKQSALKQKEQAGLTNFKNYEFTILLLTIKGFQVQHFCFPQIFLVEQLYIGNYHFVQKKKKSSRSPLSILRTKAQKRIGKASTEHTHLTSCREGKCHPSGFVISGLSGYREEWVVWGGRAYLSSAYQSKPPETVLLKQ